MYKISRKKKLFGFKRFYKYLAGFFTYFWRKQLSSTWFLLNSRFYVITVQVFWDANKNWQNLQSSRFDINIKHYNKEDWNDNQIIKRQFSFFTDEELPGLKNSRKILSNH